MKYRELILISLSNRQNHVSRKLLMMKKITVSACLLALVLVLLASCNGKKKKTMELLPSDSLKTAVAASLEGFVASLTEVPDTSGIFPLLQAYLEANPGIYGSAYALVPVILGKDTLRYAPYIYRTREGFITKYLEKSYDYSKDDWYSVPVKTKTGFWSEPYFDAGGGEVNMITYSVPILVQDTVLVGVVTADLEIK